MTMNRNETMIDEKMMIPTVEVPEAELDWLREAVSVLMNMHWDLIRLYAEESYLKKHHRAYLHVRSQAEQVCEEGKEKIRKLMVEMILGPDFYQRENCAEEDQASETEKMQKPLQNGQFLQTEAGEMPVTSCEDKDPEQEEIREGILIFPGNDPGSMEELTKALEQMGYKELV